MASFQFEKTVQVVDRDGNSLFEPPARAKEIDVFDSLQSVFALLPEAPALKACHVLLREKRLSPSKHDLQWEDLSYTVDEAELYSKDEGLSGCGCLRFVAQRCPVSAAPAAPPARRNAFAQLMGSAGQALYRRQFDSTFGHQDASGMYPNPQGSKLTSAEQLQQYLQDAGAGFSNEQSDTKRKALFCMLPNALHSVTPHVKTSGPRRSRSASARTSRNRTRTMH